MDPETEVGPLIRPAEVNRIHEWVSEAVRGGGQLLTGGNKLSETVYAPTVIFNPPKECRLMREEAFGPVVCVDPWFDIKDAIKRANALPTALHAAVFTRDVEQAMLIIDRLDASAVIVNDHRQDSTRVGYLFPDYDNQVSAPKARLTCFKICPSKKWSYSERTL